MSGIGVISSYDYWKLSYPPEYDDDPDDCEDEQYDDDEES
jgi:hypothetical protein